jgi:hypothetical protein
MLWSLRCTRSRAGLLLLIQSCATFEVSHMEHEWRMVSNPLEISQYITNIFVKCHHYVILHFDWLPDVYTNSFQNGSIANVDSYWNS